MHFAQHSEGTAVGHDGRLAARGASTAPRRLKAGGHAQPLQQLLDDAFQFIERGGAGFAAPPLFGQRTGHQDADAARLVGQIGQRQRPRDVTAPISKTCTSVTRRDTLRAAVSSIPPTSDVRNSDLVFPQRVAQRHRGTGAGLLPPDAACRASRDRRNCTSALRAGQARSARPAPGPGTAGAHPARPPPPSPPGSVVGIRS